MFTFRTPNPPNFFRFSEKNFITIFSFSSFLWTFLIWFRLASQHYPTGIWCLWILLMWISLVLLVVSKSLAESETTSETSTSTLRNHLKPPKKAHNNKKVCPITWYMIEIIGSHTCGPIRVGMTHLLYTSTFSSSYRALLTTIPY